MASVAHVTVDVQVTLALVIVKSAPPFEHPPKEVYTGVAELLVVLATVNVPLNAAEPGAPVKVTVGAILLAVVLLVTSVAAL